MRNSSVLASSIWLIRMIYVFAPTKAHAQEECGQNASWRSYDAGGVEVYVRRCERSGMSFLEVKNPYSDNLLCNDSCHKKQRTLEQLAGQWRLMLSKSTNTTGEIWDMERNTCRVLLVRTSSSFIGSFRS